MILYSAIAGFLNGVSALVFGCLVLFHNPRKKVSWLFALMCYTISFWGVSWGFEALIENRESALLGTRLINFASIFIPILFLQWVLNLLKIEKEERNKIILVVGYSVTIFFALFAFSSYFIKSVEPKPFFFYYPESGILHPFYLLFCYLGLVGYAIYRLFNTYKETSGYKRAQIKYVLLGSILGFGGGITNYFLHYNIPIPPFGNPLVAVGFGLLTYSVLRYRLMDIRVAIGKGTVYILSAITIIATALFVVFLNNQLPNPLPLKIVAPFIGILSILLFQMGRSYRGLVGRYFYPNFYYSQIAISELEEKLNRVLELEVFAKLIVRTLKRVFKLEKIAVLTKEEKKDKFSIQKNLGFNKKQLTLLLKEELLFSLLKKIKNPLEINDFNKIAKKVKIKEEKRRIRELESKIYRLGVKIVLPIIFEKKLIGIVFIGRKTSKEAFTSQDLALLKKLSKGSSTALKNASLYAEASKRKEELERFYRLTVRREMKMIDLKKRISELEKEIKEKDDEKEKD